MIDDIVGTDMAVLFVGFNPSPRSAESGHHYAGPNNQFWRLLAASGLTPRVLSPQEDSELVRWGLGSTNLVARPTPGAQDLEPGELRSGVPRLARLVDEYSPRIIAYTGKGVYLAAAARARAPWGEQDGGLFGRAKDFVLPSPSGRVRMTFDEKLEYYARLADLSRSGARD